MALAAKISLQIVPREDNGRLDTAISDGDVTPGVDVTASQSVPDDLNNVTGSWSLSANEYFSGADVTTDIVFVPVSGTLSGVGLSYSASTDDISGTATEGAFSGFFEMTSSGEIFRTNTFIVSFVDPAGTPDTTAPTQVVGLTITHSGTVATLVHDKSSDPHDGTRAGSGMSLYRYYLNGSQVATEAASVGLSPACSAGDVGTLSPSGSGTRTGSGGTIISEGFIGENSGDHAYSDEFHFEGRYVYTGAFTRSVKIVSVTGSVVSYDKMGIMARFGIEADDPFVFAQVRSGGNVRLEYRAVKGGARSTLGTLGSIVLPCYLRLKLSGSTWTFDLLENGNLAQTVATVALTPPGSFDLVLAACSSSEGNEITATYAQDNFWTGSQVTKNITNSALGVYTVKAEDAEVNLGSASDGVTAASPGAPYPVFPGTTLRFYPGFVIASSENEAPSSIEAKWQAIFSGTRKALYRPAGVYGSINRRLDWKRLYTNESVRPADPTDPDDPGYDWSLLDSMFAINCVLNENALVSIAIREVGYGSSANAPAWLVNSPYNGVYTSTSGATRIIPKYYRYSGPDSLGRTNVNSGLGPPIVEEWVYFHEALYAHLVSTGNIDKVASIGVAEFYGWGDSGHSTDMLHGIGVRFVDVVNVWAQSNIGVSTGVFLGGSASSLAIIHPYIQSVDCWLDYPDMKLDDTSTINTDRFSFAGVYQKDLRSLREACESNGVRTSTYFSSSVPNPWNYSNQSIAQTESHILWVLSGVPKSVNDDSGLGQSGTDPAGPMPVHQIVLNTGGSLPYTAAGWQTAIDTFGPPGTFAFPYFPPGYDP